MIYAAIMQSVIEYSCPVFVHLPRRLEKKMQRLDKRFFKFIYRNDDNHNFKHKFKWNPNRVKQRRLWISKKLFQKVSLTQNHLLQKYIPERLYYTKHFRLHMTRTEKYKHSFFPYVSSFLNRKDNSIWSQCI